MCYTMREIIFDMTLKIDNYTSQQTFYTWKFVIRMTVYHIYYLFIFVYLLFLLLLLGFF